MAYAILLICIHTIKLIETESEREKERQTESEREKERGGCGAYCH